MSAFVLLQEFVQINWTVLSIGLTGIGTIAGVIFGVINIVRASNKRTEQKIETVETKLNQRMSSKVSHGEFEKEVLRLDEKINGNKQDAQEHFSIVRSDIGKLDKKLDRLIELHLKE